MATAASAPAKWWAREYETIYILRADVDNDAAEKVAGRARDVIQRLGGTLTKLDNWGKRRLAYPIRKSNRGIFVYLKYVGFSDLVAELERNLRLLDQVVRFQTVLVREEVDPASVEVDPEEVQYLHVEDEEEPEDHETQRARSLGMLPRAPREERPREDEVSPESAGEQDKLPASAPTESEGGTTESEGGTMESKPTDSEPSEAASAESEDVEKEGVS